MTKTLTVPEPLLKVELLLTGEELDFLRRHLQKLAWNGESKLRRSTLFAERRLAELVIQKLTAATEE